MDEFGKIGEKEHRKKNTKKSKNKNKKSKKNKTTVGDVICLLIIITAIVVASIAGYKLYSIMMEYKAGADEYSELMNAVVTERDADEEEIKKLKDVKTGKTVKRWVSPIDVNFEELESINSDVVGWIYMEALQNISYPIVQGEDNDYYLHHTYKKESVFAGSIFSDCSNSDDFSDQNTIIYGHNMKDGSMFGSLKKYKQQETIDSSPYFWVITKSGAYKYKIFSIYTANVNGDTYTLIKGPGKETIEYGNAMHAKTEVETGDFEFTETDKIVTLSTCTGDSSTRFVVQGVRVTPQ